MVHVDKERLPRWGWVLLGLVVASIVANLLNLALGVSGAYNVVTIVALMSPVLIYVGLWYDEERQPYWKNSGQHIVGDVAFVVLGAALGSAIVVTAIADFDLPRLLRDVVSMVAGFATSWGLFWWRNTDLYRGD